jgi:hypothetical protein
MKLARWVAFEYFNKEQVDAWAETGRAATGSFDKPHGRRMSYARC